MKALENTLMNAFWFPSEKVISYYITVPQTYYITGCQHYIWRHARNNAVRSGMPTSDKLAALQ